MNLLWTIPTMLMCQVFRESSQPTILLLSIGMRSVCINAQTSVWCKRMKGIMGVLIWVLMTILFNCIWWMNNEQHHSWRIHSILSIQFSNWYIKGIGFMASKWMSKQWIDKGHSLLLILVSISKDCMSEILDVFHINKRT